MSNRSWWDRWPRRTPPYDEFLDRHRVLLWLLIIGCAIMAVVGIVGIVGMIIAALR